MSTLEKINELTHLRQNIEVGGGEAAIKKLQSEGKKTARERIFDLLDDNSFVEIGAFVKHRNTDFNLSNKETPADGVVTGYGTVEGRLIFVYSQDVSVLGGSVGEMHAKKIVKIYEQAMQMGAPIVGLLDSRGLRLQEGVDALQGYGEVFMKQTLASGVIPQVIAVLGDCAGGAAFSAGLADFVFMTDKNARLFVNSPNTMKEKEANFDRISSAKIHASISGIVQFVHDTEDECFGAIRNLIEYLPSNNLEDALFFDSSDDLNRISEELNTIIPNENKENFDVSVIIQTIADDNKMMQVSELFAKNLFTGFIRLNGMSIGVIANQSIEQDGFLDTNACKKGAKFIRFCDCFNIPILSLTDVGGFTSSVEEEKQGIVKETSKLLHAFAHATVPKVNLVLRRAFGSAYVVMNSKHIGADIVYAWPTAQIAVMNAEAAVNIMYQEELLTSDNPEVLREEKIEEFSNLQASPYTAASRGYIDDIIEPAATRKRVIAAFEMLFSKRELRPSKKQSTLM
ncbi:MAG: methylmalonyl-CoA carboxyltransferase [Epulopiscium sp.]|nr:methylmalonyl-CoA carboxyltransferase [Candidatus Epulonipiscium sp.]